MKRWKTIQELAIEIASMEESRNSRELNISQCNNISKTIRNLYAQGSKYSVIQNIREVLPSFPQHSNGLTTDQKDRIEEIVKKLFYWHILPWSRIRNNMIRLGTKR